MAAHKGLTGLDIHVPFTYTYANATARNAATGFVSADVGKFALQSDTSAIYVLTATTPTWVAVSGYSAGGTDVAVADGGTGASTASGARTNLGLVIGTDVAAIGSPAFTGNPTAPTASGGDNDTSIATTAFVHGEVATHEADTTSVHGITDTATLVVNPMTTAADLIVGGASGAPARLAKGSDGQVLTVDPSTHLLVWATPSSGFSNPMTTAGDIIKGGASGAPARLAIGSSGDVLTVTGGAPVWAAPAGGSSSKRCAVYKAAAQTISNNTTTVALFDSELYDNDTMHDTGSNTGRITLTTAGDYAVSAYVNFAADADGQRYADIRLNGTTVLFVKSTASMGGSDVTAFSFGGDYRFAANDYVELRIFHVAGNNLDVTARFSAHQLV